MPHMWPTTHALGLPAAEERESRGTVCEGRGRAQWRGGSYFRGRLAGNWGIGRVEADGIGMLGTVMNALMLPGRAEHAR
ncbi:hypothetical protein SHL15_1211 [Streptomyces hygroscopicus subsp. limoneus]|nr:hypothetical protein SHL15_1211 [Streptomyces hygroscopicus subsp. limoneus]